MSQPATAQVNLTVVTCNRLECTRECLESLFARTSHPYSLVVVDNGSADGSREYLAGLHAAGRVHRLILLEENLGVSCGYNLGWSQLAAEHYVKIDNDVVFQRADWLDQLVRLASVHADAAMLGFGESVSHVARQDAEAGGTLYYKGHVGGLALIRRDVFERLGYFCEDYGLYGEEDSDYGLRARLAGYANLCLWDGAAPYTAYVDHKDPNAAAFRQWKDTERQRNVERAFRLNDTLYKTGLRELRMERRLLPECVGRSCSFRPNLDYLRRFASWEAKYGPLVEAIRQSEEFQVIEKDLGFNFWF